MEANRILQSDVLDLLFEHRNKEYGAYELRRKYNKRIGLALSITATIAFLAIGGALLANELKPKEDDDNEVREVVIANVKEPPPEVAPPPPPPPPKTPPPPKIETAKFTPPVIKEDKEVKEEEIPQNKEMENTKIGTENVAGIEDPNTVTPPVVDEGKGVVDAPKFDENEKFTKVEIEASVDIKAWRRYLENNLQRYIEDARDQGLAPGQYTVQVKFLVERDGSVAEVQPLNDPGYGLAKGAAAVLKNGPKWSPGIQNGQKVRSYRTQPITFVLTEE